MPAGAERPFHRSRLRVDPEFRTELAICDDAGIPHSLLLGRVPAPGEPLWLPTDRAKALAYRLEKALVCTRCGTAPWEWEHDDSAYASVAEFCWGCYWLHVKADDKDAHAPGYISRLLPKAVARKLRDARKPNPVAVRRRQWRERREQAERSA